MRKFILSALLVLISNNVNAELICDQNCDITIGFDNGGHLEAIEPVSIKFGPGGKVNLGVSGTLNANPQRESLNFPDGGTLNLNAGESISFGDGGSINTQANGNIDWSSYTVNAKDLVIYINQPSDITLSGVINTDSLSLLGAPADQISLNDEIVANEVVIISTGGRLMITDLSVGSGQSASSLNGDFVFTESNLLESSTVNMGSFTLLNDFSSLDEVELTAKDGVSCTVKIDKCISGDGVQYNIIDGEILKQADDNAGNGAFSVLILCALFFCFLGREKVRRKMLHVLTRT